MKKLIFFIIIIYCLVKFLLLPGYNLYKDTLTEDPLEEKIAKVEKNPNYTKYNDIPEEYFKAVIATEDRRYYYHFGLDIIGSLRAIKVNFENKELKEGGSTISQQLAKNLYFPLDYSVKRKVAEILMALKIEKEFSKEKILEIYANYIYFGSGYNGIYEASKGYFNKKPKQLNLDECSILAGIPNAPSKYSLKVNPKLCYERQDKVLREMIKSGYITEEDREKIYYKHHKK